MKPFGVLLVTGNRTHQESYARAFAADARCHLLGVTDSPDVSNFRHQLNKELARELGLEYWPDWPRSLERPDVQIVSICAEPERRGKITIDALKAGKAVYLDKEPAVTLDDLRQIRELESGSSQTFSLNFTSLGERVRRTLEEGRIGELRSVHAEYLFAKGFPGSADLATIRQEKEQANQFTFIDSKRELLCVGWYPLILCQWATRTRFRRVQAITSNFFFENHQRNDVEDFASLVLETESGIQVTIVCGRTGWLSHPGGGMQNVRLVGTKGTTTLDAFKPRLEVHGSSARWIPPEAPHPADPMGFWNTTQKLGGVKPKSAWFPAESKQVHDASTFLTYLTNQQPSPVSASLGCDIVCVILAAYRSAAIGQPVEIDYP